MDYHMLDQLRRVVAQFEANSNEYAKQAAAAMTPIMVARMQSKAVTWNDAAQAVRAIIDEAEDKAASIDAANTAREQADNAA